MKKRKLLLITALMTILMLGIQTTMVSAQTLSEIREEIKQKEAELEAGEAEEASLASQVVSLETELYNLEMAIAEGEAQLVVLEEELVEAQKKVETQTANLNSRLRNMYKSGSIGFLDVLLDSGSFSEFLTNLDLVKKIYTSDQTVLSELELAHAEVEKKKQEVETLQSELEASKAMTQEQKATVEARKEEIAASNEEKEQIIVALEDDARKLIAETQSSTSSSSTSSYAGGVMAHPSPTCIIVTSHFGWRSLGWHSGIDLAKYGSAHGEPIVAANDGVVIRSGWYGGYGNCVMIDHGGGVVTLYGHASSLLVSEGQYVSRGQHIANIGNTGYSFGAHLHFEVQIDGEHVNPYSYIY